MKILNSLVLLALLVTLISSISSCKKDEVIEKPSSIELPTLEEVLGTLDRAKKQELLEILSLRDADALMIVEWLNTNGWALGQTLATQTLSGSNSNMVSSASLDSLLITTFEFNDGAPNISWHGNVLQTRIQHISGPFYAMHKGCFKYLAGGRAVKLTVWSTLYQAGSSTGYAASKGSKTWFFDSNTETDFVYQYSNEALIADCPQEDQQSMLEFSNGQITDVHKTFVNENTGDPWMMGVPNRIATEYGIVDHTQ